MSPRLCRVISACSRDHPAPSAPRAPPMDLPSKPARWKRRVPGGDFIVSGVRSPACRRRQVPVVTVKGVEARVLSAPRPASSTANSSLA